MTVEQWADKVEICMRRLDLNEIPPHSVVDFPAQYASIVRVIREAVAAEREACAGIADKEVEQHKPGDAAWNLRRSTAYTIATAIRDRTAVPRGGVQELTMAVPYCDCCGRDFSSEVKPTCRCEFIVKCPRCRACVEHCGCPPSILDALRKVRDETLLVAGYKPLEPFYVSPEKWKLAEEAAAKAGQTVQEWFAERFGEGVQLALTGELTDGPPV